MVLVPPVCTAVCVVQSEQEPMSSLGTGVVESLLCVRHCAGLRGRFVTRPGRGLMLI